jgi:hypothetical protein
MKRFLIAVAAMGCSARGDAPVLVTTTGADIDFAMVTVGQEATLTVEVSNPGPGATGPIAVAIAGDAADDFAVDNAATTCAGARLDAAATCAVALRFQPAAAGERLATLSITANPGGEVAIALRGHGSAAALRLDPPTIDFGVVPAGSAPTATIHVINDGTVTAPLEMIATAGDAHRGIATCGPTLAAGATCDVAVRLDVVDLATHHGQLTVTSGGVGYTASLTAAGASALTVAKTGTGTGTVTSSPGGITCGMSCSAMFRAPVVLTAAASPGSAFTGWSYDGCGSNPSCTVTPGLTPQTITAGFVLTGSASLDIAFAGNATGEVQIDTGAGFATCFSSCSVPIEPGVALAVYVATPSEFAGWGGACTGVAAASPCYLTPAAGATPITVSFVHQPKERWTRLPFPGEPFVGLAYDGSGNLIAGTGAHLVSIDPAGTTRWTRALAVSAIATGPGDSIYVASATSLTKLDAAGDIAWSVTFGANEAGCTMYPLGDYQGFARCVAVGADGSVAVHGTAGVARRDANGTLLWSTPVARTLSLAVAIESTGIVDVGTLPEDSGDGMDVVRLAASDGSILGRVDNANLMYHGMFVLDPADHLIGSSAGHSEVCVRSSSLAGTFDFTSCLDVQSPSFVDNGIARAGTGDLAWLHLDDFSSPGPFTLHRLSRAGVETWSFVGRPTASYFGTSGDTPFEVAADASGNIAIAGAYSGISYDGAWVQTFSP